MGSVTYKRITALAMGALVLVALVHASTDFDSCLFYGASHRSANHNSHVCQVCNLSSWTAGPNSPAVAPLLAAVLVEWTGSQPVRTFDCREVSAPRAPPALLA